MSAPSFDIIVFGATSFVGQILARYLVETYPEAGDLAWAAAGRSAAKLEELRSSLGSAATELPLIVADAHDQAALTRLCEQAAVVVSTVGPYDLYGDTLVKVCAETGTDYCDLTGEVRWMRRMLQAHEQTAQDSGARIVHACGFDSLPSDMGVAFLQQQAMQHFGEYCSQVHMRVVAASGAFSGGTIATLLNESKALAENPALIRELRNPYALCPPGYSNPTRQHRITSAEFDHELGKWITPFVMAAVNEPVVLRSHALLGNPYGEHFTYNEAAVTGRGISGRMKATGMSAFGKLFLGATTNRTLRGLLQRHVLPAPGEGPDEDAQRRGFFVLKFLGRTDSGRSLQTKVTGDRDPGYGSTAKMLGQCAVSLAHDITEAERPGGFWTPATIFDDRLVERLRGLAGMSFELTASD
ncbi:MAG: saccharopine dehydrogenase NADP-binding domain-containing protein [Chromatiales bacterium]|nr:MAG: saccharopine dehydrogenase NADP-binding domain-containing protein [Chromatiales bacterium]